MSEYSKICGVCGDKALGRNFCALSCESCKAFFRRNANNLNKYKCVFQNNCEMNVEMRTEVILNESEKEVRKRKIQTKRQKTIADTNDVSKLDDQMDALDNSSPTSTLIVNDSEETYNIDILDILQNNNISKETLDLQINEIESILSDESNSSAVTALSTYCETIPAHIICNTLNVSEGMKFNELMAATYDERLVTIPRPTAEVSDVSEGIQMLAIHCEIGVREQTKGFKKLRAFNTMCENDQLLLFKSAAIQMACMRSIYCYHHDRKQWTFPQEETNTSSLLQLRVFKNKLPHIYSQIKMLYETGCDLSDDKNILHMCTAIVFMHLLQRYLLMKYQSERDLQRKCMTNILDSCPPNISPLLNEIYDRDCPQLMAS
ncbi:unnamed protein product [Medioppia subpectinata]|uniref:Nuclear receptor domain-containing protein n=1 Tax=Medioppia subpectinata TaxID=1979941 RepID=A0A7R9KSM2_9ACAR|nr:unnamed protein product [Medioppia subpectinata]CAG2109041.1 unnamed protein product [Medioppia subpectinata]